ncbi:MAG: cation diffusion facilitator family transporter [Waddliaceae bacterium]
MPRYQFPDPIALPEQVPLARKDRKQQILNAAGCGMAVRLFVICIELFGVYLYNSSSLLMDVIASSFDIVSSLVLFFCIKLAARPPDRNHPFGHGRYEPLAGLLLGLFLILISIGMFAYEGTKLTETASKEIMDHRAWIIPLLATILLEISYQVVIRIAKKKHSPALASDAIHYRIDALASLFATAALVVAAIIPDHSLVIDRIGAMVIASMMMVLGSYAAKNNLDQLMDRLPDVNFFERVRQASLAVTGVLDTEKIRIQVYGPDAHVDIDIEVDPQLPVHLAHQISQNVRAEIQKDWPSVRDVTVHIEPYYPNDH